MNFEAKLKKLETIVTQMERGELALDESIKLFEEGVGLVRDCQTQLTSAEQKVKVLLSVDSSGQAKTQDFMISDKD